MLIGIVSGLTTSLILFFCIVIRNKVINPWWENRLYKGIVLEGTWIGRRVAHHKIKDDEKFIHDELNIQLELEQTGYSLRGIFSAESITADKNGKDRYKNIYKIKGHVHDNYMVIEYHPLSRKRVGFGTFLMEVKNGGNNMVGNITFLEEGDMEIVTLEGAVLNRLGSD
jgi:hypothetical protein